MGKYEGIVFAGGACYGILSTIVKTAYSAGFTLTEAVGAQVLAGSLFLWLLAWQKGALGGVSRRQAVRLLAAGMPAGLTSLFYYQSLLTLPASLAVVFLFQFVWMGTAADCLRRRRLPSGRKLAAIALLLPGSALAAGVSGGAAFSLAGMAWGLLAAAASTVFVIGSSRTALDVPPLGRSTLMATGAAAAACTVLPPAFLLDGETVLALLPYSVVLGLFGITLPPLLFTIGMPHVGLSLGTILISSELPVAMLSSLLILQEPVSAVQWAGILLILLGIAAGNGPSWREMVQRLRRRG